MLVPLKIKILYEGQNIYPPFDEIPAEKRKRLRWQKYFDFWGGWHYDRLSGFGQSDEENPDPDCQFGVVLVEAAFAEEAVTRWPDKCSVISESEFEKFYDERCHASEPDVVYNAEVLNGIRAKYGISGKITDADIAQMDKVDQDALNPDHPSPGVLTNRRKTFKRFKKNKGLKLNDQEITRLKR